MEKVIFDIIEFIIIGIFKTIKFILKGLWFFIVIVFIFIAFNIANAFGKKE